MIDDETPPPAGAAAGWRTPWVVVSTVLAVVCVGLVVLVVLFAVDRPSNAFATAEDSVAPLAVHDAVNFTSFDYRRLDSQFAVVEHEAAGAFLQDFQKEKATISQRFAAEHGVSVGVVRDWAVAQVRPRQVEVLVALDDVLSSTVASTPTTARYRLDVQMSLVGHRWLVTNVSPVA